jgi:pimeloyl-ACP methyl ester carboxylesterase
MVGPHSQAALLRKMLVQLGVERPILFDHSFGAMVALAFALDYPAAARSVVLASGYYFPTGRLPVIGDLMRHTISPLIGRLLWPGMLKLLFSPAPVPRYFERFPTWMALRPSQLRASAQEAAMLIPAAARLQRLYGALEVPALIVAGAQNRYVDHVRHSVELSRRLPRSELMLSPRAGHMVHHTDPRRVLQAIEAAAR